MHRLRFFSNAQRFQSLAWGEPGPLCCRRRQLAQLRRASSATSIPKPYYVTTPIFYVNAEPHIGHLYTIILADIFKKWHRLKGQRSILCTGTDEHGMKIQRAAEKAKMDPKAFCDDVSQHFVALAETAGVDFDHFIRTSEPEHRFAVQHFWLMLKEKGHIYQSKHEGWYSVSDETFYPESQVHKTLDPQTGKVIMASIETGKEVEWTSEENYHFRLSAFRNQLLEHYRENPDFIVPEARMRDVINQVTEGLSDLSISRPSSRLTWGIPVPDDDTQTIYVWLDALINYITKANYPFQIPGREHEAGWPANLQVIGKDIVRFHCIYWPAFLMALNLPVPKQYLTHAHFTMAGKKMSKSVGNVVNPFFAMERFGRDGIRYFLALSGGIQDDSMYDNSLIVKEYKKGLHGGIGNLVSRLTRSRKWNVRDCIERGMKQTTAVDPRTASHQNELEALPSKVERLFEELNAGQALRAIMDMIYKTNAYFQEMAPWSITKETAGASQEDTAAKLADIVFTCAESLRICGVMLQPFMTQKMEEMLDVLGVHANNRVVTAEILRIGGDQSYGEPSVPIGKGFEGVLFPPLPVED